ncbi:MAG: FTR1 family iron permease [Spirochaetaceae bacterium]|nr:FTR1 family iron permease [Spirochaetaceae bacterium]
MSKKLFLSAVFCVFCLLAGSEVFADAGPWESAEREMRLVLSEAYYRFVSGDIAGAKDYVNKAYQGYKGIFENEVKAKISEARAANIDEWFVYIRQSLAEGKTQKEAREDFNQLNRLLNITARRLDGHEEPVAAGRNWTKVAGDMAALFNRAYELYSKGDAAGAKGQVDAAYFQHYEKLGFEKIVMARISGERASAVEYQFSTVKKEMTRGAPADAVRKSLDTLSAYLAEDAAALDKSGDSPWGAFLGSLLIILREGFEAILIVGAIIAYLLKRGDKKNVRAVYWGCLIALGLSILLAWLLNAIISSVQGQGQEVIEGVTMLIAVAVLFYVSNWMISKAEADAWQGYIKGKVESSLSKGSAFSLTFAAFLAVFREGAETILFYQALLAGNSSRVDMVWLGLAVGAAALVVVYILIRVLSVKLPLKPFFMGTSILLFVMCIAFTGSGVKELQEGNIVPVTMLPFKFITIDILGIYPTLQTLIPQIILLAVTVAVSIFQIRKGKELAAKAA